MIKLERELFFGTQTDSCPQVGRGLFGCPYTNLKFKFEFLKYNKSGVYLIAPNFTTLEKKYLVPNIPKTHQKIYNTPKIIDLCNEHRVNGTA